MYGVEAQSAGVGGLAAQAPPDVYFPQAIGIQNQQPIIGGPPYGGSTAPVYGFPDALPGLGYGGPMSGTVSPSGTAVKMPVGQMQHNWSSVLDFHNSPAPWILLMVLLLYGWLHVSVRAKAGRRASAAVVL